MTDTIEDRKFIRVTKVTPSYAHTDYEGECGPDVTVDDIRNKFYHSYFGGRGAWVGNGRWKATSHDD